MNVLVVGDDYVDREVLSRTLLKTGHDYRIENARCVDDGLALASSEIFDVILVDYEMPTRDGVDFILSMREEHAQNRAAVVMLSGQEEEQLAMACISAGAQDFLAKSELSPARLRRSILNAQLRFQMEMQLESSFQQVRELAETDTLTGLANRHLFEETLSLSLRSNESGNSSVALLILDLDNFKFINDTYGHDAGDELLRQVVGRIQEQLRGNELFARLGGDEFAIVLSRIQCTEHVGLVTTRILNALSKPFEISGTLVNSYASIGIAMHPQNSETREDLVKNADIAMYQAKAAGRNQACFFEQTMQEHFAKRYWLESEVAQAMNRDELLIHFQPAFDIRRGAIVGFEALLRWQHGEILRAPDEFVQIAEETGVIHEVGQWVFQESAFVLSDWNQGRSDLFRMSINVSAKQFDQPDLLERFCASLKRAALPASMFELEITETALLKDVQKTKYTLEALRDIGFHVALDDFGTGYSSISHLKDFSIDTVKLDKSMLIDAAKGSHSEQLLRAVVTMLDTLGLRTVVEGVETQHQLDLCLDMNVSVVQGYFLSRPLARKRIEQVIINNDVKQAMSKIRPRPALVGCAMAYEK